MKKVWFFRHGQSASNADILYVTLNHSDIPLTPAGQAQADKIPNLFNETPGLIVVSPFLRTRQTAQKTVESFPLVPVEEWPVHEFTFLSPVVFNNTNAAERRPYVKAYWKSCDPDHLNGEGAETFVGLIERVKLAREKIINSEKSFITIFSHGLFIEAFWWFHEKIPAKINHEEMLDFYKFMKEHMVRNTEKVEFFF
jgi:broad specificity phosphatase PhoE